ncbi:acetyltransferase [Listeria cornellensis]|uniref:PglD N-terminal domain-containing protein n=1 Tax=Listeria cornellensis FSL F6-0969 TaxID=1265820 RepID=W7BDW7_9LIST|nr:acetyltransferase [Listeria cornellensis]EUJ25299.1 hypothetical protein PCORN_18139 [Listeria cornellensis FSL F6-0969]
MLKELVVIGDGSVTKMVREIIALQKEYQIIAILDDSLKEAYVAEDGIYFGPLANSRFVASGSYFFIAVGNNEARQKIFKQLNKGQEQFPNMIHPAALISPNAKIGYGNFIMAGAIINVDACVGNQTIVNSASIIGHDAVLGDFTQVSPGVVITGYVQLENGAYIGANATVLPDVVVSLWAIVGAGSTVVNDVDEYTVVVGTPAKYLKQRDSQLQMN